MEISFAFELIKLLTDILMFHSVLSSLCNVSKKNYTKKLNFLKLLGKEDFIQDYCNREERLNSTPPNTNQWRVTLR